jgi:PAS domain S-box-containing protein
MERPDNMPDAVSRKIADVFEQVPDLLVNAIAAHLPPPWNETLAPFLPDWIAGHVSSLREGRQPNVDWVVLVNDLIAESGESQIPQLIAIVRGIRAGLIQGLRENTDLAETTIYIHVQYLLDEHFANMLAYWDHARQEALLSEQRRQRILAEMVDKPMVTVSGENEILLTNQLFARLLGRSSESFSGRNIETFCNDETAREIQRALRQRRATGTHEFEGVFLTPAGKSMPVRVHARPMFDAAGRRDGLSMTLENAEYNADNEEDYFSWLVDTVVNKVPVSIQVTDREGTLIYRNSVSSRILPGDSEPDALYCCTLYREQYGQNETCPCRRLFQTGDVHQMELYHDASGTLRWYLVTLVPLPNRHGQLTRLATCLQEITQQKRATRHLEFQFLEQQRTSLASQLAVSVAHQLRNPLGVVIGFAEMLSRGLPPEQVPAAVNRMLRNGLRCKEIVEDLLEFGQGYPEDRVPTDPVQIVSSLVMQQLPRSQSSRITWHMPESMPPIECVPEQLAQVFMSLLKNALEASSGKVSFSIRLENREACITIEDDGPGIAPEIEEKIFQPFFTTRKEAGALGLGLSLSRSVVQEYSGSLHVCEGNEKGACFEIRLPLMDEETKQSADSPAPETAPAGGERILILDDEVDLLEMLSMMLELHGYTVDTTGVVSEAMALVQKNAYDAVVLDVQLPGDINGPQFYEYLITIQPALQGKTLFITADTMNYKTRKFLERISCPSMEKPFLVYDFLGMLKSLTRTTDNG